MIAVLSCTKSKYGGTDIEARLLYSKSPLFRLSYNVLKKFYPDVPIYILSAKYGLIKDTDRIDYYQKTFKSMSKKEKQAMIDSIDHPKDYIFIGGKDYKDILKYPPTIEIGANLPIGKKLKYLKQLLIGETRI